MKFIYLTSKTYPATTADHLFVREMAKTFADILGDDFRLVVANDFSRELRDTNVINLNLKMKHGRSFWYFFWLPAFIIRKHLNTTETIFFSNDPNLLSFIIFWKKLFGLKYQVISDWHMLFGNWRDRFISTQSTKLITTTRHLRQLLSERYQVPFDTIEAVYGGVTIETFDKITEPIAALRNRLQLPVDAYIVGYVGFYKTMKMAKGLDTMINALALIQDKNVKMAFVGGRHDEIGEYSRLAEKVGVADRIIFVPVIPTEKIAEYEKAMDMLVIPYPDEPHFRDYGFPMKAYEYMASKRPILYSDLPIIAEVLGDYAISFRPGDAKDLADKIMHLKNNPTEGENLANKAHIKVANYTWDKRAENIIAFVQGI